MAWDSECASAVESLILRACVKEWSLLTINKGMLEFMAIQVVAIMLLFAFPAIATWLPERLFQTGALVVSEPAQPSQGSSAWIRRLVRNALPALA